MTFSYLAYLGFSFHFTIFHDVVGMAYLNLSFLINVVLYESVTCCLLSVLEYP